MRTAVSVRQGKPEAVGEIVSIVGLLFLKWFLRLLHLYGALALHCTGAMSYSRKDAGVGNPRTD
jgi:hypothetical protein